MYKGVTAHLQPKSVIRFQLCFSFRLVRLASVQVKA